MFAGTARWMTGSAAILAIVAAPLVVRADAPDDKPVTLGYTYKEKDVFRQKTTIEANLMGMDIVVTSTSKMSVKEIKKNGDVVLEITDEGSHLTGQGIDQDLPPRAAQTIVRNKVGKLIELKTDEAAAQFMAPEVQKLSTMIGDVLFPEKPVKAGETWQTELDNPIIKGKKVVVKGTFIGVEKLDGMDVWKVKQSAEAATAEDGTKMSIEITTFLDPATGEAVKSESIVKDLPTQFGAMSSKMKQERLKPDAPKKDK